MSRDPSGNYTLPAGNPVVTGTTIESVWANTTMNDLKVAMTDSLSRSGAGSMLAQLKLVNGTNAVPAIAFGAEVGTGFYRAAPNDIQMAMAGHNNVLRMLNGRLYVQNPLAQWKEVVYQNGNMVGETAWFGDTVTNVGVGLYESASTAYVTGIDIGLAVFKPIILYGSEATVQSAVGDVDITANNGIILFALTSIISMSALGNITLGTSSSVIITATVSTLIKQAGNTNNAIVVDSTGTYLLSTAVQNKIHVSTHVGFPNIASGATQPGGLTSGQIWRRTTDNVLMIVP